MKDSFVELSEVPNSSLGRNFGTEPEWACKDASGTSTSKEDEVQDQTKKILPEDISHLPPLEKEEYFPTFVHRQKLIRIYKLFSGKQAVGLTRIGRKLAKRLLKYILKAHKRGQCWNGEWDILDIRVQAGGAYLPSIRKQ